MTAESARSQRATLDYARDLRSSVPAIRAQAVLELGRRADKSAVPAIIQALKDSEPQVRREAARALGVIKDAEAVPALIAAARDSDKNVRAYAAYALGEIKDDHATDALLQAFRDPEWCVRDQAAWALREIRDPRIAGPLAAMLKGEAADVATVAWLLRSLGDKAAVESLVPLLRQGTATARLQAVRVLSALKSEGAIDPLLAALQDTDANVRFSAVEALARSSDARVSKAFKAALAGESDQRIRAVMEGLVRQASHEQELAAWWSFDDRNAGIAKDVTGHGNDGEIKGATPAEGRVGAALKCGKGKFVSLGKVPNLPIAKSPLTVMAWIKPEAKTGVVVARGGAFCGFSLYLKDGAPRFGIRRNQQDSVQIAIGKQEVGGDWTHLAGVIKSDALELHVNGKLVAATKTEGYISGNCGQGMEIGFDLGNSPAEITDAFDGLIDEVKVFRAALSGEEIAEQFRAGQTTGREAGASSKAGGLQ